MSESQKCFKVGKIAMFDEETEFFGKKTLSSANKASLPKCEGGKKAEDSRPFGLFVSYWELS